MEFHPSRWVCLARYAVALTVAAALPGCEADQEHNVSLRCGDLEELELELDEALEALEALEAPDASAEPESEPEALGLDKGSPDLSCPECGSHWTITTGPSGSIDGGRVFVYLDQELGESITSLTDEGRLHYGVKPAHFRGISAVPDLDGYVIDIGPFPAHEFESGDQSADLRREKATLSIQHEKVLIGVRLGYVNNKTGHFEDPPVPVTPR